MKTRVMIVEEQASVRQMLGVLLPQAGPYEVAATAGDGLEALRLLQQTCPSLIILDLSLPGLSGVGLLRHLREKERSIKTLVFCGTRHRETIVEALRARPHGFISKFDPWEDLVEALRMVNAGFSYLTPFATRLLDEAGPVATSPCLTPRELSVVQMVAEGSSNKEISGQLSISTKTVEHHRARVMEKLKVRDTAGLTRYAARAGLISLE